ncbi:MULTISPECIES: hypothetical protein [unclassified Haladaptatus]|uniref:hypothetical protein n=1 Tax=unclassified Haladaptatus TaxID=2622732 RepID=UPI0023E822E0|nr:MULTISPECIES: hypothetical protein [unclassified Haladaptatus]
MNSEEFLGHLKETCADAIDTYRREYPEASPLSEFHTYDSHSAPASKRDICTCFAELTEFYDALFEVNSTPFHPLWRDHLVYDYSWRKRVALTTGNLPGSLTLVSIEGRYSRSTGYIGVSGGQLPAPVAYSYLASELCHAYQHRFGSPTWDHPYLLEGLEVAASIRALEHLAHEWDDSSLAHVAARQRVIVLLQGVLAHGTRQGGITQKAVRQLGVTKRELVGLRATLPWRVLGRFRPRYRWSSIAFFPEYHLFGSLLLVSETMDVSETYARAFHGEHPWGEFINDFQSTTPGWVWRRYHPANDACHHQRTRS